MESLGSHVDTGFNVYIELADSNTAAPIKQWLLDCADLQQVPKGMLADLQIWDWAAFQYHKQLGDVFPKDLLVIESKHDANIEQQVLIHGAQFMWRPAQEDILLLRLSVLIQKISYVKTLEGLTVSDTLTGLFNRRKYDQELDKCWRQGKRQNLPCSLLLIDVDYFKRFNDRYGHLAGDQCLRELALIFKQTAVRPHDVVARIGGEEFAIILSDTPLIGAQYVAEQIVQTVASRGILNEDTPIGHVTVSVGIACIQPDGSQKMSFWQQQADDALYGAKAAGRNQVMTDKVNPSNREAEIF